MVLQQRNLHLLLGTFASHTRATTSANPTRAFCNGRRSFFFASSAAAASGVLFPRATAALPNPNLLAPGILLPAASLPTTHGLITFDRLASTDLLHLLPQSIWAVLRKCP
ncbi:hypothetical protein MN608_04723 [Microdochium nivale]|nr:hypothetical protein MN608_04723 [Microdochium nivale]